MTAIFKIVSRDEWMAAKTRGRFDGAAVDHRDGFIHFSDEDTIRETAARHFAGRDDLLLVTVAAEALGPALRREVSRGGALFPHLYGPLDLAAVLREDPLPLGADGRHVFPPHVPA